MKQIAFCTMVLALALATQAADIDHAKDYVCGKEIAVDASTLTAEANGVPFWFCSEEHRKTFQSDPGKALAVAAEDYGWWLGKVWAHYFEIRRILASDSVEGILPHAKAVGAYAAVAVKLQPKLDEAALASYREELEAIVKCSAFPEQPTLETARLAFKDLSEHVIFFVRKVASKQKDAPTMFLYHCGMAKACWAQETDDVGNPYFGKGMLKCGEPVPTSEDVPFDPKKGCTPGAGCGDKEKGHSGGC